MARGRYEQLEYDLRCFAEARGFSLGSNQFDWHDLVNKMIDQSLAGGSGGSGTPGSVWRGGDPVPSDGLGVNTDWYLRTFNGDVYEKVGGLYQVVGNIRGPQGTQGQQGIQGNPGNTGIQGPPGDDGLQGDQGIQGPPGNPGTDGADGAPGVGVPVGGTTDQLLSKNSATNFDTGWSNPPASDPAVGVAGLRTLGTGAQQAAAGNHTHSSQDLADAILADLTANAADTYLRGLLLAGRMKAGTFVVLRGRMSKTAAGVAAPIWTVRVGTNGTTADTARVTLNGVAQTAVIDDGEFIIVVTVRTFSATAVLHAYLRFTHTLTTTGLQNVSMKTVSAVSSAFDLTPANTRIGVSVNPGAAGVWTFQNCTVEAHNLA